jgi:hypothetical protein
MVAMAEAAATGQMAEEEVVVAAPVEAAEVGLPSAKAA